jgi:murein DD-endopeptidase MepM/ murein hydrolase activator NlpD
MQLLRPLKKKLFTPVTIMLIPHCSNGSLNLKMPYAMLGVLVIFVCVGFIYTFSLTMHAVDYFVMKHKYTTLAGQMQSMQATVHSLKESELEFKRIFSLGSKKQVLEAVKAGSSDGSIDIEELKRQVSESMASVSEIRGYLAREQNIYRSTPKGWPVGGKFTSGFGMRKHPQSGQEQFHSGVDISVPSGTPVKATAEGIVSFAGWSRGNGNVVVIEHGHGFSTVYAHNSSLKVKTGETVKQGKLIAASGSTGNSTGPHVHYEVWKNGQHVNPSAYAVERSDPQQKAAGSS